MIKNFFNNETNYPDKFAVVDPVNGIYFSGIREQISVEEKFLEENNLKDVKLLGIQSKNCKKYVFLIYTCWKNGIIPVLFNYRWTPEETIAAAKLYGIHSIIKINDSAGIDFDILRLDESHQIDNYELGNIAVVMFTSGSTGVPKAVKISFKNLEHNFFKIKSLISLKDDDIWLASLPFYHIGGFATISRALLGKNTLAVPFTLSRDRILEAIKFLNPTIISLVPTMLKDLMDMDPDVLRNFKAVFVGGAKSHKDLILRAINSGIKIINVYGSTETTSMVVAANHMELLFDPETAGQPLENVKVKIFDEQNNDAPIGKEGLIGISSNTIAKGYLLNDDEWKKKFIDNFYLTGDYGKLDSDGKLYISDRKENLIISGGENIRPTEIESALLKTEGINDAFVFGLKDERWGEIVCALLVSSKFWQEGELKLKLKEKLSDYKIPKRVAFVEEIPRNEMGKTIKSKAIKFIMNSGISI